MFVRPDRLTRIRLPFAVPLAAALIGASLLPAMTVAATPRYNLNTLAGKVAALRGTAGLQVRFSSFIEEEAGDEDAPAPAAPITPTFVLGSPLDGNTVQAPDVTVNQDTAGAPQNETAIAVDPNNPNRVVAAANDYVSRTWSCAVDGTPCSALGDGYSGTYVSNDGGQTWCCTSTDPDHLGTLIPGVTRLTGGQYDAGGDPALAWDSHGRVFYAGLGFNRASAPNTVAVNRGTFDGAGNLSWSAPTFINQTTSPSTLNDKEWIAVDHNVSSPFRDHVYVSWTRFLFNARTGAYTQSPIFFASSSDGGATFTTPKAVSGNVLYGQGSRPVVSPDGSISVFWEGSTRLASLNSTYVVRSTDGGATWSKPTAISRLTDSALLVNTAFRNNSYPAAAAAPNGDLYATWTTETDSNTLNGDTGCAPWLGPVAAGCRSYAVVSKSTDGGITWSAPARAFGASSRTAIGYPVAQPSGGTLNAPDPAGAVEDIFPAIGTAPNGTVYLGAYRGDVVSPWQTCAAGPPPPEGRINCTTLGDYIHNTRLDYVVTNLTTTVVVSTHPINTRNGFGGGFFGDYTDLSVGSDGRFHAFWTDSNNKQSVVWFYGLEFTPTLINQEDVVTASGAF
jgi:hypothetical protein